MSVREPKVSDFDRARGRIVELRVAGSNLSHITRVLVAEGFVSAELSWKSQYNKVTYWFEKIVREADAESAVDAGFARDLLKARAERAIANLLQIAEDESKDMKVRLTAWRLFHEFAQTSAECSGFALGKAPVQQSVTFEAYIDMAGVARTRPLPNALPAAEEDEADPRDGAIDVEFTNGEEE